MNFTELLDRYNVPWRGGGEHHHVSHGWIGFDCPYCSKGSERFRAGYSLAGGHANCWG